MDDKLIAIDKSNEPSIHNLMSVGNFDKIHDNYCKDGYLMIPLKDILNMKVDEDGMLCTDKYPTIELYIKMLKQYY